MPLQIASQSKQNLRALLSIFFALELLSSTSHAELISHITAEGGMVKYDLTKDPGNGWYSEPNSSYPFKLDSSRVSVRLRFQSSWRP